MESIECCLDKIISKYKYVEVSKIDLSDTTEQISKEIDHLVAQKAYSIIDIKEKNENN